MAEYVSQADSGATMRRRFCPTCGTPLFAHSVDRPDVMVVRVGALDDPALGRPGGYIWTGSAPDWGHVDPTLENCPGQPGLSGAGEAGVRASPTARFAARLG